MENSPKPSNPPRPLDGIRVLDFSWVRAGPWATRWLGALGAEVIKIEWPDNERGRRTPGSTPHGLTPNLNNSGNFSDTNANKLSVTLNVRTQEGLDIARRLVAKSDVVIENFSSRVLTNWGLGYEALCRIKPDIVYVSMSGYGHTGRHHTYKTFGPVAQAASGLTFMSGLPDSPPAGGGWSYLDDTGGLYGAMCVLTGLYRRNMTGEGQHIDQSQMITGITLTGPALLDRTVNGRASRRDGYPTGNRSQWPGRAPQSYRGPLAAPHNAYPTAPGGYNDWCAITCTSDDEWLALRKAMGDPEWAGDGQYATLEGRLQAQAALDEQIGAWSRTMDKYTLTERCQAAGVPALPVQGAEDRVDNDPQLAARGMYQPIDHAEMGRFALQNAPFRFAKAEVNNVSAGPRIGEHNREVLQGLLGLDDAALAEGYADGTFWPEGQPLLAYHEEMLT